MPTNTNFIISGFGLENIRTAVYRQGLSEPLEPGGSDFGEFTGPSQQALNSGGEAARTSILGTPVFSDAELRFGAKSVVLTTVLMTVTQQRNIVTTPITGRSGTIKEYVSEGDYMINLKGAIVNSEPYLYPTGAVRDLLELLQVQSEIDVISDFLRLFDVNNIVVTDYSFPQQEGFQNVQLFDINCLSDTDELLIFDA